MKMIGCCLDITLYAIYRTHTLFSFEHNTYSTGGTMAKKKDKKKADKKKACKKSKCKDVKKNKKKDKKKKK